jgi:hypothetical protein
VIFGYAGQHTAAIESATHDFESESCFLATCGKALLVMIQMATVNVPGDCQEIDLIKRNIFADPPTVMILASHSSCMQ